MSCWACQLRWRTNYNNKYESTKDASDGKSFRIDQMYQVVPHVGRHGVATVVWTNGNKICLGCTGVWGGDSSSVQFGTRLLSLLALAVFRPKTARFTSPYSFTWHLHFSGENNDRFS